MKKTILIVILIITDLSRAMEQEEIFQNPKEIVKLVQPVELEQIVPLRSPETKIQRLLIRFSPAGTGGALYVGTDSHNLRRFFPDLKDNDVLIPIFAVALDDQYGIDFSLYEDNFPRLLPAKVLKNIKRLKDIKDRKINIENFLKITDGNKIYEIALDENVIIHDRDFYDIFASNRVRSFIKSPWGSYLPGDKNYLLEKGILKIDAKGTLIHGPNGYKP